MSGGGRRLRSYLLLPRPGDTVKWWIAPLTFGVGVLAARGVSSECLARAVAVWAILELLLYQARYQWNDIRGFAADQRHPDAAGRGRLPGPAERGAAHIRASRSVAALRLALVAALVVAFPALHLARPAVLLTVGVFGAAGAYEALRAVGTGRSDAVPPPASPLVVAIWIVVGAGYAIRGVTGLALAVDVGAHPALAVAAAVTMWAYGVAFVTGRWALEGLAFARRAGSRLGWRCEPGQAREHLLALARWLPDRLSAEDPADVADWRPLRGPTALGAPWNVALLAAATAAAVTGALLTDPPAGADAAGAGLLGAGLAGVQLTADRFAATPLLEAAALAAVLAAIGHPRPLLAALPWLVVCSAYLLFTASQCPRSLGHPLRDLLHRRPAWLVHATSPRG